MINLNLVGFDIYSSEIPTNKELIITYKKDENTVNYSYKIIKDEKIYEENTSNIDQIFNLDEEGIYKIEITTYNKDGISNLITSGNYIIDKTPPVIEAKNISIIMGDELNIFKNVKVTDNFDGNITNKLKTNIDEININNVGNNNLTYIISDSAGNEAIKTINLRILENNSFKITLFSSLIGILVIIILCLLYKYNKSIKLEKRLNKYCVTSLKGNDISIYDEFKKRYLNVINKFNKIISKSVLLEKYSNKYDKYVMVINEDFDDPKCFISTKFISSILMLILAIITSTLQLKVIGLYEIFIPLLFGFFLPDIIYIIKYRIHRKKIENDLLQAIIIMNNAFKSGRSVLQAIELVMIELEGAIGKEYKKMYMELTLGLDIETVFKRFSDRINLEEVTYLTASLSILNKSGGNIIKVFSSIEKSLFDKKKLKLELNSLTGSSKIIIVVLFLVPVLFVGFISLINPGYFAPLFNNTLGIILIGIMIIYYIIYIICVKKIMKVRM